MNAVFKSFLLGKRLVEIALRNPQRLRTVLGVALSVTEGVVDPQVDLRGIPSIGITDLLPADSHCERITLALFGRTEASVSALEYLCLATLLKRVGARRIFEFGTYKGVSITQMALNMPEDAAIYTLDLPEGDTSSLYPITVADDRKIAFQTGKGGLIPEEIRPRIQFIRQDSAQFDETPLLNSMDLVFVDGAHNDEYVRNDSEKAWRMLRSGGVLVWHDFAVDAPDVIRYLLRCPFKPQHVSETSLAIAFK